MPATFGYSSLYFQQKQPSVLFVTHARLDLSGARNMPRQEIDALVRFFKVEGIVNDLIASSEYKFEDDQMPDYAIVKDVLLTFCIKDPLFSYL